MGESRYPARGDQLLISPSAALPLIEDRDWTLEDWSDRVGKAVKALSDNDQALASAITTGDADAITDHEAKADPHSSYLTAVEGDAAYMAKGTLIAPNLAAAPASPATGTIYFDTALAVFRGWNGTAWTTL